MNMMNMNMNMNTNTNTNMNMNMKMMMMMMVMMMMVMMMMMMMMMMSMRLNIQDLKIYWFPFLDFTISSQFEAPYLRPAPVSLFPSKRQRHGSRFHCGWM